MFVEHLNSKVLFYVHCLFKSENQYLFQHFDGFHLRPVIFTIKCLSYSQLQYAKPQAIY